MSETHAERTENARETHGLEAGFDFELDGPNTMSDLPIEERIGAWMAWAGYLKQRIRDHYRPRIAELEDECGALRAELDRDDDSQDTGNPTSFNVRKWGTWEMTCPNCGTFYVLTAPTVLTRCHCPVCCCEQEVTS